jgi:hypothetical protein
METETDKNHTQQSNTHTGDLTSEFCIHSQECSELATQYESANTANLKCEVITREERIKLKEERKKLRRELNDAKKELKNKRLQIRLSKMSPNKRAIFEDKIAEKAERKILRNSLDRKDNEYLRQTAKEYRLKRNNDRFLKKTGDREIKLAKMSPKRAEQFLEKIKRRDQKRDAMRNMTLDEKKTHKQERKEKRLESKKKWDILADNWTDVISEVDCLIVDGNNVRGGGPKRHSRDEVIQHVAKIINHHEQLKNARTICIFDHHVASYTKVDGVDVQFSGDNISDDVIVDKLVVPGVETMVITCDRELARRLLQKNCKIMRNMTFMRTVPGFESKYKRLKKDVN